VSYLDISNGQFKAVAQIPVPGVKVIPPAVLERALDQRYTSVEQIEKIVKDDLGVTWERIATNVYMFVDRDNVFYGGVGATIVAYGLADAQAPEKGIKVLRTLDLSETFKEIAAKKRQSLRQTVRPAYGRSQSRLRRYIDRPDYRLRARS
jgi:hypothetical protein